MDSLALAIITNSDGAVPPSVRHLFPGLRTIIADTPAARAAVVQRHDRIEGHVATDTIGAFNVRYPVRRPRGIFNHVLRDFQGGRHYRQGTGDGFSDFTQRNLVVLHDARETRRGVLVAVVAHPDFLFPTARGDLLRFRRALLAKALAAGPTVMFRGGGQELGFTLVTVLK